MNVTQFLTGGELGGVVDFNREMLAPTRAELGRIAVGLVDTVNTAHRNGMDARGPARRRLLLRSAGRRPSPAAANTGTGSVAVTITGVAALEPTNYRLTLQRHGLHAAARRQRRRRADDRRGHRGQARSSPNGISIVVSGAPAASDQFLMKPLEHVAGSL